jgi:hypothetical protein
MKTQKVEINKVAWWQGKVPFLRDVEGLSIYHVQQPDDCEFEVIECDAADGVTLKTVEVAALVDYTLGGNVRTTQWITVTLRCIAKEPICRHGEFGGFLEAEPIVCALPPSELIPKVLAEIRAGIEAADCLSAWDGRVTLNAPVHGARVEFKIQGAGITNQRKNAK